MLSHTPFPPKSVWLSVTQDLLLILSGWLLGVGLKYSPLSTTHGGLQGGSGCCTNHPMDTLLYHPAIFPCHLVNCSHTNSGIKQPIYKPSFVRKPLFLLLYGWVMRVHYSEPSLSGSGERVSLPLTVFRISVDFVVSSNSILLSWIDCSISS